MESDFPSPDCPYPLLGGMKRTCFLKNFITRPNILVGDYTYYDDETDVRNFEKNVLYHFDFLSDKLIIGKFCQIASGATFLMKTIRKRFSDEDIELLLKIKWWNWAIEKITKNIHFLVSNDVKGLVAVAGI